MSRMTDRDRVLRALEELMADPAQASILSREDATALLVELARVGKALELRALSPVEFPAPATDDRALTAEEVAERLGLSVEWVYRHKSKLGGRRLSHRVVRFPESAVVRYLNGKKS